MNIKYLTSITCTILLLFSSTLLSADGLRGDKIAVGVCENSDLIFDTVLSHSKKLDLAKNIKANILKMQFEYKRRMIELESRIKITELTRHQAILENLSPNPKKSQPEIQQLNETAIALKKDLLILQLDAEKNLLTLLTSGQQSQFDSLRSQDEKSCKETPLETPQLPDNLVEALGGSRIEGLTTVIAVLSGDKLLKWLGTPVTLLVAVFALLGGFGIKGSMSHKAFLNKSRNEIDKSKSEIDKSKSEIDELVKKARVIDELAIKADELVKTAGVTLDEIMATRQFQDEFFMGYSMKLQEINQSLEIQPSEEELNRVKALFK